MLVDSCLDTYHNGYTLTQVHHHRCGRVLHVHIRRDQPASKSFALVEVLTPCWLWTELAAEPPPTVARRHAAGAVRRPGTLMPIGEAPLERAAAILAPPDPTG